MVVIDDDVVRKELKRFNWGAFFVNWLWGVGNLINHWSVWVAFFLSIISLFIPIVGLLLFLIAIYMGINGNKLAYCNSKKTYKTFQDFVKCQRNWAMYTFILIGFVIILGVSACIFALLLPHLVR